MVTYFVGGYPASGKSTVAAFLQKYTGLPIVTFDDSEFRAEHAKFLQNTDNCILDMVFDSKKTLNKYFRHVMGEKVFILVEAPMELAMERNALRERTVPHMAMLTYHLTHEHPFITIRGLRLHRITNTGSFRDLEDKVEMIVRDMH